LTAKPGAVALTGGRSIALTLAVQVVHDLRR
jgi:hypothetical protein